MSEDRTVGLIGIGAMGSAMGTNLLAEGFTVVGYDVRPERVEFLEDAGGIGAGTPAEVLRSAQRVILSLPSVGALQEVVEGSSGLTAESHDGAVIAETSTLPLDAKRRAAERLAALGITLLDAPISGTGAQARTRDLVFYASGPREAFARVEPVLARISRGTPWVGEFGAGSMMKFVSNLLVAVHTMAAGEALNLAAHAGLDPATTHELLVSGAGNSRMLEVRGPMVVAGDYPGDSATVRILGKDVELIRSFAESIDVPTPLLSVVASFFTSARGQGLVDADPAALAVVLDSLSPPTTGSRTHEQTKGSTDD